MAQTVWQSTVVRIGEGAEEMFQAGVFIFFGEPVPDALAEVSLVHNGPVAPFAPIQAGDELCVGDTCVRIDEVGSRANENLEQLGHIVLYLNQEDINTLPGAVRGIGPVPTPAVGDTVVIRRPEAV